MKRAIRITLLLVALCVFGGCHLHNGWPRWGLNEKPLKYLNSTNRVERF